MPRLAELAARVGGEVRGDGDRPIAGIAGLERAGAEEIALWSDLRLAAEAAASRAGALLVDRRTSARAGEGRDLLVVDDARGAFADLVELFHPAERPPAGVHPTAVVAPGAEVDPAAHLGPYAVVGAGSRVEAGAAVEAHAVVGRGCRIGAGARLRPHAVVYDGCEVGERCEVHAGAVIGADGFGYARRGGLPRKVPQVGRVVLEADVEVGANSTIDRATLGETRIGTGTKIDNLVQIGHNARLGRGCLLTGQVGVSGSARLGDGVVMAGQSGVADHVAIGDGAMVAAKAAVLGSVPAGHRVAGVPAVELAVWRRQVAALGRLPGLLRRLLAVEKRLGIERAEREEE